MRHYHRPIPHPKPDYRHYHNASEEEEVRGWVRSHVLWRGIAVAALVVLAALVVVWLASPPTWWAALMLLALVMTLVGMPAWVAAALDTAEDTREDAEYRIELRHLRDRQQRRR